LAASVRNVIPSEARDLLLFLFNKKQPLRRVLFQAACQSLMGGKTRIWFTFFDAPL
jgi:hypothetical protein